MGLLHCKNCSKVYPIINYIPRFVEINNYASSFGFEWNKYSNLRSDKYNKTKIIHNTVLNRTGWNEDSIRRKLLLECGCGAGNDTEVLLDLGAKVFAFDISISVESALQNNEYHKNLFIIQADLDNLPLKEKNFDIVFCHRVIQHTPNPKESFRSISKYIKKGGELFLHSYGKSYWTLIDLKHILRMITKRMNYSILHKILKLVGPFLYPLVGLIQKSKDVKLFKFLILRLIPFDNLDYTLEDSQLTKKEKYYYSLLNVFDRLTPKYENRNTAQTIINWFKEEGFINLKLRQLNPVIITGFKN